MAASGFEIKSSNGYWAPIRYMASPTRDARYVKLVFRRGAQIARVEIQCR